MEYYEPAYLKYLYARAAQLGRPLSGAMELTSRCNFDCKMCYIHRSNGEEVKKNELSTAEWIRITDEMRESGVLMVLLTGGEPLARADFKEIYLHMKKSGFNLRVNTNGSMLDEETTELFKKYPPSRLNISLYGANDETYERVTGRKGMYDKVVNNILAMKNAGIQVRLSFTVSDHNSSDISEVFKWARENDLFIQSTCYMFPSVRSDGRINRPSAEDTASNIFACEKAALEPDRLRTHLKEILEGKKHELSEDDPVDDLGERMRCRAGRGGFWITYKGELTPCGMMPEPKCSLLENSFEQAWEYIRTESEKIHLPPKCKTCEHRNICDVCAAVCYAETGSFSSVPEYVCRKTEKYYELIKEETADV